MLDVRFCPRADRPGVTVYVGLITLRGWGNVGIVESLSRIDVVPEGRTLIDIGADRPTDRASTAGRDLARYSCTSSGRCSRGVVVFVDARCSPVFSAEQLRALEHGGAILFACVNRLA